MATIPEQRKTTLSDGFCHQVSIFNGHHKVEKIRAMVAVDPKILASYAGTHELRPKSETKFFPTAFDAEIEFFKDDRGAVSYLMLRQNGHETKALKK